MRVGTSCLTLQKLAWRRRRQRPFHAANDGCQRLHGSTTGRVFGSAAVQTLRKLQRQLAQLAMLGMLLLVVILRSFLEPGCNAKTPTPRSLPGKRLQDEKLQSRETAQRANSRMRWG